MNDRFHSDLVSSGEMVIGMVHLLPLPGSPGFENNLSEVYRRANREAEILEETGFDALIVENYNDDPYLPGETPLETRTSMAGIVRSVREAVRIPVGVNVQFNDVETELAIAQTCGAEFVRIEVYVEHVFTSQGTVSPASARVQRSLRDAGLGEPTTLVDVHSKGTYDRFDDPRDIVQRGFDAQTRGADAIVVTGLGTGKKTPMENVQNIARELSAPVLVGSGVGPDSIRDYLDIADGVIVGSATKKGGEASREVSRKRAETLIQAARRGTS